MKRILSVFPLLKTPGFYLITALLLLGAGLSGFLYLPEEKNEALPFEKEQDALEDALAAAEEKLLSCTEEERAQILEEKAFFEAALTFRLSPWSSYFAEQALFAYARALTQGDEPACAELEEILRDRDKEELRRFWKKHSVPAELDARLLMAEDTPESPGQNALLYEITLLEESLETGRDRYFGTERALSKADKAMMTRLLGHKEEALSSGNCNPVPANRETLLSAERLFACLLSVLLLATAGYEKKEESRLGDSLLLLVPLFTTVFLCSLALFCTTLLRAPGTAEPFLLQWGGSLPFFPALFLRLFCRVLLALPLMLLCSAFREEQRNNLWKLFALLPVTRFLLGASAPLLPRGLARLLSLGELGEALFPSLSPYALRPMAPCICVLLWAAALGAVLCFLWKKEQKLSPAKQKVSLEKSEDL